MADKHNSSVKSSLIFGIVGLSAALIFAILSVPLVVFKLEAELPFTLMFIGGLVGAFVPFMSAIFAIAFGCGAKGKVDDRGRRIAKSGIILGIIALSLWFITEMWFVLTAIFDFQEYADASLEQFITEILIRLFGE